MSLEPLKKLWEVFRPLLPATFTGALSLAAAIYGAISGVSPWDVFLMAIALLGLAHLWLPLALPAFSVTSKLRDYLMSPADPREATSILPSPETFTGVGDQDAALRDPRHTLIEGAKALFEETWARDCPQFAQDAGEGGALTQLMIRLSGDLTPTQQGERPWTLGDVSLLLRFMGARPWKDPLLKQYLTWGDTDSATRTWLARAASRFDVPQKELLALYERLLKEGALPAPKGEDEARAYAILLRLPAWQPPGAKGPQRLGDRLWSEDWLDPTETAFGRLLRRMASITRPFRYWGQWLGESWRLRWQPASSKYIIGYTLLSLLLGFAGIALTFQGSNLGVGEGGQRPIMQGRGSAYNPLFHLFGQPRDTALFENDFPIGDTPLEWETTASFIYQAPDSSPTSPLPQWFGSMIAFNPLPTPPSTFTLALDQARAVEGRRVGWSRHPYWCRFLDYDIAGWKESLSSQQVLALRLTPGASQWACVGRNAEWWQALSWSTAQGLQRSRASTQELLGRLDALSGALGVGLEHQADTPRQLAEFLARDIADTIIPRESRLLPEVSAFYAWDRAQALLGPLPPEAPLRKHLSLLLWARLIDSFESLCTDPPRGYEAPNCNELIDQIQSGEGLLPWALRGSINESLPHNQRHLARHFLGVLGPIIGFIGQDPTLAPPELGDLQAIDALAIHTLEVALGGSQTLELPGETPSNRARWLEALFQILLAKEEPLPAPWAATLRAWTPPESLAEGERHQVAWLRGALLILRGGDRALAQTLPRPKAMGVPLALGLLSRHPRLQDAYFGGGATPRALESEATEPPWGGWSAKRWATWVRINSPSWSPLDVWELDIYARWLLRHPAALAKALQGDALPDALDWISLAGQPRGLLKEIPNRVDVLQRFARAMARGLGYWHHLRRSDPREAEDALWEKISALESIYSEDAEELGPDFTAALLGSAASADPQASGSQDILLRRLARRDLMARSVGEMLATFVAPSEGWGLDPEETLNRWIEHRLGGPGHTLRAHALTVAVALLHQRGYGPYDLDLPRGSGDPALEALTYGIEEPLFPILYYHLSDPALPLPPPEGI